MIISCDMIPPGNDHMGKGKPIDSKVPAGWGYLGFQEGIISYHTQK